MLLFSKSRTFLNNLGSQSTIPYFVWWHYWMECLYIFPRLTFHSFSLKQKCKFIKVTWYTRLIFCHFYKGDNFWWLSVCFPSHQAPSYPKGKGRKFFSNVISFYSRPLFIREVKQLPELHPPEDISFHPYLKILTNNILKYFFPRKQELTFHANCLQWRQFAWNVEPCLLGKIRKISSMCWISLESGKVKGTGYTLSHFYKGDNFCNSLLAFFHTKYLRKKSSLQWKNFMSEQGVETEHHDLRVNILSVFPNTMHIFNNLAHKHCTNGLHQAKKCLWTSTKSSDSDHVHMQSLIRAFVLHWYFL